MLRLLIILIINYTLLSCMGRGSDIVDFDRQYMHRAIELAAGARGKTSPNPCVGCVIVDRRGEIVGEGYHTKAGESHAEVVALNAAGEKARGATAYVSLEPCNHYGRTPPCTLALIRHGISRVVAGMVDPDSRVSGKGLQYLREHNITVHVGTNEKECKELNAAFVFRILTNKPYAICMTFLNSTNGSICNWPQEQFQYLPLIPEIDSIIVSASDFAMKWKDGLANIPSHVKFIILIDEVDSAAASNKSSFDITSRGSVEVSLHGLKNAYNILGNSPHPDFDDTFQKIVTGLHEHGEERFFFAIPDLRNGCAPIPCSSSETSTSGVSCSGSANSSGISRKARRLFSAASSAVKIGCNAALVVTDDCGSCLPALCRSGYIQKLILGEGGTTEVSSLQGNENTETIAQSTEATVQSIDPQTVDILKRLVGDKLQTVATAKKELLKGPSSHFTVANTASSSSASCSCSIPVDIESSQNDVRNVDEIDDDFANSFDLDRLSLLLTKSTSSSSDSSTNSSTNSSISSSISSSSSISDRSFSNISSTNSGDNDLGDRSIVRRVFSYRVWQQRVQGRY